MVAKYVEGNIIQLSPSKNMPALQAKRYVLYTISYLGFVMQVSIKSNVINKIHC